MRKSVRWFVAIQLVAAFGTAGLPASPAGAQPGLDAPAASTKWATVLHEVSATGQGGTAAAIRRFIEGYAPPPTSQRFRTIICLGGESRTRPAATARAFRAYPGVSRVLFTGRSENVARQRDLAIASGLPAAVAALETQATDTPENAYFTAQMLGPLKHEPTLVVSNLFHLYRARMLFRHYGFTDLHLLASDYPGVSIGAARIAQEARNVRRNWFRIQFGRVPD